MQRRRVCFGDLQRDRRDVRSPDMLDESIQQPGGHALACELGEHADVGDERGLIRRVEVARYQPDEYITVPCLDGEGLLPDLAGIRRDVHALAQRWLEILFAVQKVAADTILRAHIDSETERRGAHSSCASPKPCRPNSLPL